jgi:hypothetical protein
MAEFLIQGETLEAIGEAIRGKTGGSDPIKPKDMASQISAIESGGGGTEEIEQIIDKSGVLDSTEGTVEDKVEMLTHYVDVFKKTNKVSYYGILNIEHIYFYIDFVNDIDFQYARNLKTVAGVDVSKLTTCRYMFNGCRNLVSIQRPFDMSKHSAWHMTAMFDGCTSLVDVGFVAESIKESIIIPSDVLSKESKNSIFNGLAYVTTAQTLTLHKDAKILQSQVDSANAKGWTVAGGTVVSEEEYYA